MVRLTYSCCITHSPDVMQHRHGWIPSILLEGPIITEEELTCLPLIKVVPDGQYTGAKLNSVVRMMRGLLEQKVPLQEFDVRIAFNLQNLSAVFSAFYHNLFSCSWQNLQNLEPLDDCLIAQTKENKKKNRYKNVVPCKLSQRQL